MVLHSGKATSSQVSHADRKHWPVRRPIVLALSFGVCWIPSKGRTENPGIWVPIEAVQPCTPSTAYSNAQLERLIKEEIAHGDPIPSAIDWNNGAATIQNLVGRQAADKTGCESMCALDRLFGHDVALRVAYLGLRYGLNATIYDRVKGEDVWKVPTAAQLDTVIASINGARRWRSNWFGDTMRVRFPAEDYKMFEDEKLGDDSLGQAHLGYYNDINLSRKLLTYTSAGQKWITFHEIGHHWTMSHGSDFWKKQFNSATPASFVSPYGSKAWEEDAAESYAAYVFAPRRLQKTSQAKYEYLKFVYFDGLEYISPQSCSDVMSTSSTMISKASKRLKSYDSLGLNGKSFKDNFFILYSIDGNNDEGVSKVEWAYHEARMEILNHLLMDEWVRLKIPYKDEAYSAFYKTMLDEHERGFAFWNLDDLYRQIRFDFIDKLIRDQLQAFRKPVADMIYAVRKDTTWTDVKDCEPKQKDWDYFKSVGHQSGMVKFNENAWSYVTGDALKAFCQVADRDGLGKRTKTREEVEEIVSQVLPTLNRFAIPSGAIGRKQVAKN